MEWGSRNGIECGSRNGIDKAPVDTIDIPNSRQAEAANNATTPIRTLVLTII